MPGITSTNQIENNLQSPLDSLDAFQRSAQQPMQPQQPSPEVSASILVVEDDQALSEVLVYNLKRAGYDVRSAGDGRAGLNHLREKPVDLVILDVMLPLVDGLEVCRQIRADPAMRDLLVLVLTARSEDSDQIVGFHLGADDYVTKPVSIAVLVQRVAALLRRRERTRDDRRVIQEAGIVVDTHRHRVTAGDQLVDLTPSEFALLEAMIRDPGRAFSRSELIDAALGGDVLVLERTIDVHIRALRKKLDTYADRLETVRGVGYRFQEPPEE